MGGAALTGQRATSAARTRQLIGTVLAWTLLGASVAAYLWVSARAHEPFQVGVRHLRFFDLRVYRGAALRILDDGALYSRPIVRHLGFTYPPAAALLLAPLALVPLAVDKLAVCAANIAALLWLAHSTLALAGVRARRWALWSGAALIAAAALWTEPVTTTLGYGQIDLLIVALIMFDLSRADDAPYKGIALGIAAGLKLTPLLFIVYLLLSGRRRIAAVAATAFVATVLVSFAAAGSDAARYWGGLVLDSGRVGGAADIANQSLRGALARLTDTPHPGAGTEVVVAAIALTGLVLAVAAARRGQYALGFSLCAITTLLASPVSWTHHWCLAIPALVLLMIAAQRARSLALGTGALLAAAVDFAYAPERFMTKHGIISGIPSIASDAYVLAGLLVLICAGAYQWRLRLAPSALSSRPVRSWSPAHPVSR